MERTFQVVNTRRVRLRLTPQYFLQQSFDENGGDPFDSSLYGLRSQFSATLSPRTSLTAFANFNNLSFGNLDEELRASVRLRQVIGTHLLSTEYSFRDRLFNGSLGFQTVQQSVGAVLTSPVIPLGRTGINLTYQAGINSINAETDRLDLLDTIREDNDVTLTRFQASASLSRAFWLWRGKPLPPPPELGIAVHANTSSAIPTVLRRTHRCHQPVQQRRESKYTNCLCRHSRAGGSFLQALFGLHRL
ncbi:MAG: DUF3769 domain-containing protein [Coleofasciculaceae cyanobacterium SM2_3_26]|nr:DUF3769 domain-containing protein [Coleofasciculaceae cyanobacterium SM2_3_26]